MTLSRALVLFDVQKFKHTTSLNTADEPTSFSPASSIQARTSVLHPAADAGQTKFPPTPENKPNLAYSVARLVELNEKFLKSRYIPGTSTVCARLAEYNMNRTSQSS